jgi:nitrogen fixation protein FixH
MSNVSIPGEGAPLTGAKVLLMLVAFFFVVGGVNGVMIYDAISTFRGEVVDHPFEAGLAYDTDIAAADAQSQRRWKVDVTLAGSVSATFRDAQSQPVSGLAVTGAFAAPADKGRDRKFELKETSPGVYAVSLPPPAGVWDITLEARRDGQTLFQSKNRLTVR